MTLDPLVSRAPYADKSTTRSALSLGFLDGYRRPGAFAIKPKPRDYTDPEWQKTITDEELAKAIVKGGAAVSTAPPRPHSQLCTFRPSSEASVRLPKLPPRLSGFSYDSGRFVSEF